MGFQPQSLGSHALYRFIKLGNFLIHPCGLGFLHVRPTDLILRFLNGELGCSSHADLASTFSGLFQFNYVLGVAKFA